MRKVIAAAVAAAFIAPAVFAAPNNDPTIYSTDNSVTLYGSLRAFADYVDGRRQGSAFKVEDGGSRIGFLGNEKLNSDLAVIWQVESRVNADQGQGSWASRNTFVGLDSATWGTLRLGNFDSAYTRMDTSGPQAELFDNYGASVDPKNAFGFYGRANATVKNSINYETPNVWNGFIFRASYGVDNDTKTGNNDWLGALSGTFTTGGFSVGAGYQYANRHLTMLNKGDNNVVTSRSGSISALSSADSSLRMRDTKNQAYKLAVNYKFDTGLNIGAAWERNEDKWGDIAALAYGINNGKSGNIKQDTYFVAANFPVGDWLVQGGYGWADKLKGATKINDSATITTDVDKTGSQMAFVGGQYSLSKRTRVYAYGLWIDNDSNAAFSTGYDSIGFSNAAIGAGKTTGGGVSLGLRTDF